jgi:hypothetical protein
MASRVSSGVQPLTPEQDAVAALQAWAAVAVEALGTHQAIALLRVQIRKLGGWEP